MKAPDKIYIQPNAHDGWFEGNKPNDSFVEYIRKDALLGWVKSQKARLKQGYKHEWKNGDILLGGNLILDNLIDKIESL